MNSPVQDNLRIAYRLEPIVEQVGLLTVEEESTLTVDEQESLRMIQETLRSMRTYRQQGWEWRS